jgi:hypothetical protein
MNTTCEWNIESCGCRILPYDIHVKYILTLFREFMTITCSIDDLCRLSTAMHHYIELKF